MDDRYYAYAQGGPGGVPMQNMHRGTRQQDQHQQSPSSSMYYQQAQQAQQQNYPKNYLPQQPMQRMSISSGEIPTNRMGMTNMNQNRMQSSVGSMPMNPSRVHPQNVNPSTGRPFTNPSMMGRNYGNSNMYSNSQSHMGNSGYPLRHSQDSNSQLQNSNSFESEFPALGGKPRNINEPKTLRRDQSGYQEDFPALGGSKPNSHSNSSGTGEGYTADQQNQSFNEPMMGSASYANQQAAQNNANNSTYGLTGLLRLIRGKEGDAPPFLAKGIDLTTLGLNLNTPNMLYTSFTSPFADSRTNGLDPSMKSYKQPKMQPVEEKASFFEETTLFFLFYAFPQDKMQLIASRELYTRGWRYHIKDQHWYQKMEDGKAGSSYYFEPLTWTKVVKQNFTFHEQDFEISH